MEPSSLTDEEDPYDDPEDDPRGRHPEGEGQPPPQSQTEQSRDQAEEPRQGANPDLPRTRGPGNPIDHGATPPRIHAFLMRPRALRGETAK